MFSVLVALAWMYVVTLMAVAEMTHANGSILGGLITFVLYGLLPLSIVMYIMRTPQRRRAAQRKAEPPTATNEPPLAADASSAHPDTAGHAPAGTESAGVPPV